MRKYSMSDKSKDMKKYPKPVKLIKSKTPIPFVYATMTPLKN